MKYRRFCSRCLALYSGTEYLSFLYVFYSLYSYRVRTIVTECSRASMGKLSSFLDTLHILPQKHGFGSESNRKPLEPFGRVGSLLLPSAPSARLWRLPGRFGSQMAVKRQKTSEGTAGARDDLTSLLDVGRSLSFDWGTLYRVIPLRTQISRRKWYNQNGKEEERKAVLVGFLLLREFRTGLRIKLKVVQDRRDGSIFCHFPSYKQNTLMGEIWSEEVTFDNAIESKGILKWATDVWLQSIVDGQGVLAYRSIRADKYEFHPVESNGHLKANGYGRLPWSEHARSFREQSYTRGDFSPATTPSGVAEGDSGSNGTERYHGTFNGSMDDVLQEPDGVSGVREALDRDQWVQAGQTRDDPSGEPVSDRDE